jgi:CheY-like chemotaxis protein/signal transduction histidine kinase
MCALMIDITDDFRDCKDDDAYISEKMEESDHNDENPQVPTYTPFLRLKKEGDRRRFVAFRRDALSCKQFGCFLLITTLIVVSRGLNGWVFPHGERQNELPYALALCGNICAVILGLCPGYLWLLSQALDKEFARKGALLYRFGIMLKRNLIVFEYCLVVFGSVGVGLFLMSRTFADPCLGADTRKVWAPTSLCNAEGRDLPITDILICTMTPIMLQTFAKCPHQIAILLSWLSCITFIVIAIVVSGSPTYIRMLVMIAMGFVLYEIERRELDLYVQSRKIHRTEVVASVRMLQTQKSNIQATILRQVVANISHDLLSPIQALDMGFESLGNIFEDNSASLDQLSKAAMESLCLAAAVAHKGRTLETPTVSNEVKPKFGASSFKQSSIINSSSIEIESGSAVGTVLPPIVVSGSNPSPKRRTFKDKVADADAAEKAVDDTISGMRTNIESSLSSSGSHLMECKELLQTMRGSLTYMSMIINRCLDVSKVHGGLTLVPNAEFFNYMDSINKSVRYMMDMQNDICITVGECTDRISPQIYSDKKWFEGNMFCILSNAIKYSSTNATAHLVPGHEATPAANPVSSGARNGAPMVSSGKSVSEMTNPTGIYLVAESDSLLEPEGPVRPVTTVVINICYVEPESSSDSPQMKIEVHDSGPSVPANVVADFFLAPEQAARKQTGGSGMGLYTLRKRVEALGGRCGAQIREGYVDSTGNPTGTTVWFSVPYKRKSKRRYIPHPETAKAHRNRMSGAGSMPDLTAGDGKLVVSGTIVSGNGGSSKSSVDELLVTIDDPKKQQASPQHSWRSMIQQTKKVVFRGTGDKDHAESSASDEDTFDSRPLSKKSGKSHPTNKASVSFARKVLPTLETNISIDLWDSSACATIDNADDDNNGSDFNGRNPRDGSLHRPVPQAQEVMAEETNVPCGIASLNSSTLGAHDRSRAKHQDAPTQAAPSVPIAASGKMLVPGRSPQAGDGSGKSFQSQQSSQKYVTIKEPAAGQAAAVGVDTVAETASVATSSMKTPPLLFPTSPKIVIKKSLSVLVVDDSMSIMKIMKMSLERGGHGVQSAVNGKIALDFLLENHYDVVLLDLQMPVMGGIECCQRFREFEFKELQNAGATVTVTHSGVAARIKRTKRQLIIGMSANGEAMTRQDALDADMDEFIAKPFPMQSMMAALKYLDPDTMA